MEEKYKTIKLLGKGATAEVFLVQENATGEYYAMKVCQDTDLLEWEAFLLRSLQSDRFPLLKEYEAKNQEYLVIEYIEGISLQELLAKREALEEEEILYIMEELLKGLQLFHMQERPILYRDLKPSNIMIDKAGRIRLIDLGAACYEGEDVGKRAGTYGYAAPEQFWPGAKPNRTCDIYAAGKVFAYLLSGKNPAEPPYDMEQYCKGLKGISPLYKEVLARSLAVNPQARYESCREMLQDIQRAYHTGFRKKTVLGGKNEPHLYKKCIWRSEYRRIF